MSSKPTLDRVVNQLWGYLDDAGVCQLRNGCWFPEQNGRFAMAKIEQLLTHFEWHPGKVVALHAAIAAIVDAAKEAAVQEHISRQRAACEALGRDPL